MTARADEVVGLARYLLDCVTFDDRGVMVGPIAQGGNGGLLSRETIHAAEQLRRALNAYDAERKLSDGA